MAQDTLAAPSKYVVVGGSAGSLDVVLRLVSALPHHTGTVVIIVVHRKNNQRSILAELLSSRTTLPVREVEDKDPILCNAVYLAPPDYHLLVEPGNASFALDSSEKVYYSRPSIDVTFESLADAYGSRVTGILLSGANADGAAGLARIKQAGGLSVVQDPATAHVPYMPRQALKLFSVDRIVSGEALPAFLGQLCLEGAPQ